MEFKSLQLSDWIIATLDQSHINKLTEIQESSLPLLLNNKSLIITSQTGSGKTLCYLLPILNRINFALNKVQAIIILPTKELARQIYSKINDFRKNQPKLKCSLLIGNQDINQQQNNLRSHPGQIVVGTVSRINDLLKNKSINHDIDVIVMDEADMLMDLGFIPQIVTILNIVNSTTLQKIACSATTHLSLANSFKNFLGNTSVVTSSNSIWVNDQIQHNVVYDRSYNPLSTLDGLLKNINPYFCIIFTNTKNVANTLYEHLLNKNFNVCLLHKDLTTRQRKNIYREINTNRYQFLVATDLASRGLDINGADIVISYGLPEDDIWYMHRVGRVGRMKNKGTAYVIYQNDIDSRLNRLSKKAINWKYLFIDKTGALIEKPLKLRIKHKNVLDQQTNNEIRKIIRTQSQHVKPGYKRKIKAAIHKIKQKKRHEFIERKIKQMLVTKNIRDSKQRKR